MVEVCKTVRRAFRKAVRRSSLLSGLHAHRHHAGFLVQRFEKRESRAREWAEALLAAEPHFPPWIFYKRRGGGRGGGEARYRGWWRNAALFLDESKARRLVAKCPRACAAYLASGRLRWVIQPPLAVRCAWAVQRWCATAVCAIDTI